MSHPTAAQIKETPSGTSYDLLHDHERSEINQLDGIRGIIGNALTDSCDLSIDKTARLDIKDGLDTCFKTIAARIADIEAVADKRLEDEQDKADRRFQHD